MGSLCSSPDENQVDRTVQEAPVVLWGDILSSESRVVMTLLTLAKVRYEFQHVSTPVEDEPEHELGVSHVQPSLRKEDFLEVPEDLKLMTRSKRISGRSIYIGEREAFFKYISTTYKDIEGQLVPKEHQKRLNQCLDWHKAVLQPAVKRLVESKRRLQFLQARRKTASNSMLFPLSNEQLQEQEQKFQLSLLELHKYILPAIEDQLLIRKFFCSPVTSKGQKCKYSLADIVIYHEVYTAMAYAQVSVDHNTLSNTSAWLAAMTQEAAVNAQNNKLQEFLSSLRLNVISRQNSTVESTEPSPQLRNKQPLGNRGSLRLVHNDSDDED